MPKLYFTNLPQESQLEDRFPGIDGLTLHTHILLRKVSAELESNLDSYFSQYGLSSGRYTLLILLSQSLEGKGMMPSEIAAAVGVTQATISGLINSLEKAQLVKRASHEKDGRSFVIQLTPQGKEMVEKVTPHYFARLNDFWAQFDELEKKALAQMFTRMVASVGKLGQPL